MHTVSQELSKKLHAVSGWYTDDDWDDNHPKYTLGFLMRKLPPHYAIWRGRSGKWYVAPVESATRLSLELDIDADSAENAAAMLCMELFRQNILTKEPK